MPHLPLIIVIFVSPFLDEYLSTAFCHGCLSSIALRPWSCKVPNTPAQVAQHLTGSAWPSEHSAAPWPTGPSASTCTTSHPKHRIPTLAQAGRYLPGVCSYSCNCMNSQVSFPECSGEETYPFLYFSNSFYFLYLFFTVSLAWSAPFFKGS